MQYQRQGQGLREGMDANGVTGQSAWRWWREAGESGDRKLGMAQDEKWSEQATRDEWEEEEEGPPVTGYQAQNGVNNDAPEEHQRMTTDDE